MSAAWERYGRRQLALTRWQCEPEAIPPAEKNVFSQAWARQRRLERAIIQTTRGQAVPQVVVNGVARSLADGLGEDRFSARERQAIIRHHARLECQFTLIAEQVPPPDALTVMAWYNKHQQYFMRPEQRLTRHILLTVEQDRDDAYRQMLRLRREAAASSDAFAQAAQRYSHCPSALEGGRLGWVSRGLLYPELDAALFELGENTLSAPIETALGWHLLRCEGIRPPAPMALDDALPKAREYVWRQQQKQRQRQWLTSLMADADRQEENGPR
ncbi:nitrogen fixation protein NifM [Martelella alba]|uniref:Parvulin-like PPIase n=1 Tax=Martelella alba TaxID=2590451 RepID=A0ABY2SGT8_9HYPH|nr:nitrogen fixation protein NifM [Martelella alba]TKI03467.1 nitrogen fixation protein NifM [Martelella alba]